MLALAGVVLASREEVSGGTARGAGFAVLSARSGSGSSSSGMDNASDADIGWAMLGNRITSFSLLLAAFAGAAPAVGGAARRTLPVLATVGTLDITANGLFAIASTEGLVSLVSVLGSLYPLTTVALAAVVLRRAPAPDRADRRGDGARRRRADRGGLSARRLTIQVMSPLPWAEPFAAALALRHEPGLVLLESLPGFGSLGTRSYLAARPAEVATDGIGALDRLGDGLVGGLALL